METSLAYAQYGSSRECSRMHFMPGRRAECTGYASLSAPSTSPSREPALPSALGAGLWEHGPHAPFLELSEERGIVFTPTAANLFTDQEPLTCDRDQTGSRPVRNQCSGQRDSSSRGRCVISRCWSYYCTTQPRRGRGGFHSWEPWLFWKFHEIPVGLCLELI